MPNWKKVIVSGSNAILNNITASGAISASGELYAGLSAWAGSDNSVVVYNDATGELMYTGSYSSGGSGEDNDWLVSNTGGVGTNPGFITSSKHTRVDHEGFYANSGSVAPGWGIGSTNKNSTSGFRDPDGFYLASTATTPLGYTGLQSRRPRTHVTAEAWNKGNTRIYPVSLTATGSGGQGAAATGLNEGYPYNYLVFNQGFYYQIDESHPDDGGGGVDGPDEPQEDSGLGGQLVIDGGIVAINDVRKRSLSSPSASLPPLIGTGEAPPSIVIRPQAGILFFETGSTLSKSGSYLATSASAQLVYNTSSHHLSIKVGSKEADDLKEVMHISKSGDNPRIGVGISTPLKAFDFKDVSDTTRGGEILIRGSRTTKGAEVGDEAGRINFTIDSGSYTKVETSGSTAEIVALVDSVDETGIQGSLSLRVSEGKTLAPQQVLKIVGSPGGGPSVEVTGSSEFSSDVTVKENLIIDGKINSFITASSGISASGDIETSEDVIATNFVVSENGNLKTVGSGEYVNLQTDQIALGFGSSWSILIKKDEGFIFNEEGGAFGGALARDFRVEGTSDTHLFFITGGDNAVGIGTSTPDEKLTVNGNIKALGDIIATGDIIAQNYIVSSSVTYMTQSFSSGSTIFGDTIDDTHLFTGSVDITGSLTVDGMIYPTTDGNDGQVIITDGDGSLTFGDVKVYAQVKNISGVTLAKGTPVHATASASPPSGNVSEVIAASASLASSMPATFVLDEDLADEAEGRAILSGFINGVDTSAFKEGDVVYVGPDGGYTTTKPTGTNLIQNLGIITKVDASNGSGYIYGSGRSNDVPNLLDNQIFFGSGSNQSQQIHISGALDATTINNITASGDISASGTGRFNAVRIPQDDGAGNNRLYFGSAPNGNNGHIYDDGGLQIGYNDNDILTIADNNPQATIAGNLRVIGGGTGNITASGEITSNTFETISTTLASDSATNVDTFNTSSYTGAIYDYVLIDTTVGARAGQFMIAQDNGSVTFTDNSTRHLFDGTAPEISGQVNGANVEVQVTNGNGYTFKSFVKKL